MTVGPATGGGARITLELRLPDRVASRGSTSPSVRSDRGRWRVRWDRTEAARPGPMTR